MNERRTEYCGDTPNAEPWRQPLTRHLWRALRLRCPRCGAACIFRGWFSMHDRCAACRRKFNRAPGFFLGSIFVNYGVTAVIVVFAYFGLYFGAGLTGPRILAILTTFILLFPLWFFRYARALWLGLDEFLDPWPNEEERRRADLAEDSPL